MSDLLAAIPGIVFVTLGYVALCAVSPLGACRRCRGFGFHVRTDRRGRFSRGRDCSRCRGHGRRVRLGRRLYNLYARERRNSRR